MTNKPEQAQRFLAALTGEPSPNMWWQRFFDPKNVVNPNLIADARGKEFDPYATRWFGPLDTTVMDQSQAAGYGAFFCVNGGGRTAKEITQFRAVFMDSDGAPMPAEWRVPPHAIIKRDDTHFHAYWFIDGDCTADEWRYAQKQIALHFGSDETMVNADRVLRVPGYHHMKDPANPVAYEIHTLHEGAGRYKLRDIIPYFNLDAEKSQKLITWVNQQQSKLIGGIEGYADTVANRAAYAEYLAQRAPISVSGSGGNNTAFSVASAGADYGLPSAATLDMMMEGWNDRCDPPWEQDELVTILNNAYRYKQNATGNRALSKHLDAEYTPLIGMSSEPVNSIIYVEEVSEKKEKENVAAKRAALIEATAPGAPALQPGDFTRFYGKNHSLNAESFLAQFSPNGEIIYKDEELFIFNGKIYAKTDTKMLHYMMKQALATESPSMADINGAVDMVKTELLGRAPNRWPMWKFAPERDTKNLIVFDNGALDLETNEWFEHSAALMSNACLPFAYDHTAQCPSWLKFLDDVWGGTDLEPLIESLQKWFGYLITNDVSQQKMAYFIGDPRAGKGTMMRVIQGMLGKHNVASPSLSSLLNNSTLHYMSDKMAAIFNDASDASHGRTQVVETIKKITGQDSINVDRKYKSAVDLDFRCRMMLTCNKLPEFSETSTAMIDRGIFFYLEASHSGKEDIGLGDRLMKELPGIINWAIMGLQKLRAGGGRLTNPPCVMERIDAFRLMSSPIETFVRENLIRNHEALIPASDAYSRYQMWATKEGRAVNFREFARHMNALSGITMLGKGGELLLKGAFLKPYADEHTPPEGYI